MPEDGLADCGELAAAETGREVPQEVPGVVDGEDLELKVTAIGRTTGIHVGAAAEVSPSWRVAS